jgi:hypothetical protein
MHLCRRCNLIGPTLLSSTMVRNRAGTTQAYNLRKITLVDKTTCFHYNYNMAYFKKPPSSRGLGHLPFAEKTGIRLPLGVRLFALFLSLIFCV